MGRCNKPWKLVGQKPISDLWLAPLCCWELITRESPQEEKWEEKRPFCQYVPVQGIGKDQVEGWHLKKVREGCSKHEVVAQARETMPFSGWVWMPVLQGGRAVMADGLLTVLGNYCPLPSLKQDRGPRGLGRCGHRLSGFKKSKQKNLPGISLQVSGAVKTKELEAEVCLHCSLGAQTASAATVTRRCLPTGQRRGHPCGLWTEWQGKPPPQFTQLPATVSPGH